jgi:hypothetical protein
MASKSLVIPFFEKFDPIQCHHTNGFFEVGGFRNCSSKLFKEVDFFCLQA